MLSKYYFDCTINYLCDQLAATPAIEESIVLAPPSELNVLEGNALFVPCVSSGPSQPSFSRVVSGLITTELVTQLGLEMGDAAIADSGVYTCSVGGMTADVMVTVTPSELIHSCIHICLYLSFGSTYLFYTTPTLF